MSSPPTPSRLADAALGMVDVQGRAHHHHLAADVGATTTAVTTTTGCWSTSAAVVPCSRMSIYVFARGASRFISCVWCDKVVICFIINV